MPRVSRLVIGIFGRINAGKSTLMNLLTQQETSITDPAPGTTADIKSAIMEIHGLGPVRILDTAGLDESGELGEKKRRRAMAALEEVDLALLVVDPVQVLRSGTIEVEEGIVRAASRAGRSVVMVANLHADDRERLAGTGATVDEAIELCARAAPDRRRVPLARMDLTDSGNLGELVELVSGARPEAGPAPSLLPFLSGGAPVLLHIPLDEESPEGRLLRPQEMAMEHLLRLCVPVGLYRTDLKLARSGSATLRERERLRFLSFLRSLGAGQRVQLVLTDSQAVDVMDAWVSREVPLTTFSIMMMNDTSGGDLELFIEGAGALDVLAPGDRVLVAEACTHDRIAEDIGTVQIPRKLSAAVPGVEIEHSLGREFPDPGELRRYALVIHCGGCMISRQKFAARVSRLADAGVPVTNYGLVLSWLEGPETLGRVLEPWREV